MRVIVNSFHLIEDRAVFHHTVIQFPICYGFAEVCIHNLFYVIKMAAHSLASWILFLEFLMQQKYLFEKSPCRHYGWKPHLYIFFLFENICHKTP